MSRPQDILVRVSRYFPLGIVIIGAILITLAAATTVSYGDVVYAVTEILPRLLLGIVGATIVALGIYLHVRPPAHAAQPPPPDYITFEKLVELASNLAKLIPQAMQSARSQAHTQQESTARKLTNDKANDAQTVSVLSSDEEELHALRAFIKILRPWSSNARNGLKELMQRSFSEARDAWIRAVTSIPFPRGYLDADAVSRTMGNALKDGPPPDDPWLLLIYHVCQQLNVTLDLAVNSHIYALQIPALVEQQQSTPGADPAQLLLSSVELLSSFEDFDTVRQQLLAKPENLAPSAAPD